MWDQEMIGTEIVGISTPYGALDFLMQDVFGPPM